MMLDEYSDFIGEFQIRLVLGRIVFATCLSEIPHPPLVVALPGNPEYPASFLNSIVPVYLGIPPVPLFSIVLWL